MRRKILLAAAGVAVAAVIIGAAASSLLLGERRTPAGQPPLGLVSEKSFPQLRERFNAAKETTRVLLLLSPT